MLLFLFNDEQFVEPSKITGNNLSMILTFIHVFHLPVEKENAFSFIFFPKHLSFLSPHPVSFTLVRFVCPP